MKGVRIAVVAAHPDDEILGCGGTMAKLAAAGAVIDVLILAEGVTSRQSYRDREGSHASLSALERAAQEANRIVGVASVSMLSFPDNRMDGAELLDVVKAVEKFLAEHNYARVYTHHAGDVNVDHRIVHQAVVTACRPMPDSNSPDMFFFEVPSSTEWQPAGSAQLFVPNWYENIEQYLEVKLNALEAYASEMRPWPHARSLRAVESLARWRGASVGKEAAESFILGRCIR